MLPSNSIAIPLGVADEPQRNPAVQGTARKHSDTTPYTNQFSQVATGAPGTPNLLSLLQTVPTLPLQRPQYHNYIPQIEGLKEKPLKIYADLQRHLNSPQIHPPKL